MTGDVRGVDITSEMQVAYLDYAMSVIVARALPDVRDGLKPVHRRILYAMHDMGITSNKPYKKSARIVGEVLGKYHPHNDTSVYDAMVRMAQEFSLRYPLVDGQGNFGSIDGDNAAAMRYTEARLAAISDLMLTDIEKETVDWRDNFDTTLKEPGILPAALPNMLVNGANGIAVGMATSIPPHNLAEVVDATVYLIDQFEKREEIGVNDLLKFIKGPDFPTGGILFRFRRGSKGEEEIDAIAQAYATGRGRLILQAKAHFEEMSRSRSRIVVTDLPYQTNKTNLLERIALLVRDGKIDGITDLRDESDRAGMRIVIELTRNVQPQVVLDRLLKLTPMQQTFGMSLLALVNGEPRTLTLKQILVLFVEHRQEIIRRRSQFDLEKARARSHIVEGLLKALDILDDVIRTIRRSQRVETARNNLMKEFGFTQLQAQAILDMPLRRLTALERRQLQDEHKELRQRIAYLEELLADDAKILGVVREELLAQREQHADRRRTQIVERPQGTLTATDLLPDRRVWVALGASGEVRRLDFSGISRAGLRQAGQSAALALLTANTRDLLYIFSADGRCRRLAIHEIPQEGRRHLADLTSYSRRDGIAAALALPQEVSEGFLFLVTREGSVKRIAVAEITQTATGALDVMRVAAKDQLACAFVTPGNGEVILVTRQGRSIRFPEEKVRVMGRSAAGVAGISLKRGDEVLAALPVAPEGELLTVTTAGFVKRTHMSEFGPQGRGGGGIIAHKISARSSELAGAAMLTSEHTFAVCVTRRGVAKPVAFDDIPSSGRSTQGSQAVDLAQSDAIASVHAVSPVVVALENPPQPAPQANGKVTGATGREASEDGVDARPAQGGGTRNGQGKKEPVSKRSKRTSRASAADSEPAPKKGRSLDSEAARRRKPEGGKAIPSNAKEKPAAESASPKSNTRRSKPTKRAARDGARQTATEAGGNSVNQPSGSTKAKKPASNASSPQPADSARRAPKSEKSSGARAEGRSRGAPKTEDQPVQGRLLGESSSRETSTKRKRKLDRVSSVTRGPKKKR